MSSTKPFQPETLALHAGQSPDATHGARATPIYYSTSYVFPDSDHAAALFNLERPGHVYTRISNPTTAVLEERIAALEDGIGAIAGASGQAALHRAITTLMGCGGHIVASRALYGGSHNLLHYTLPRFGITTTFVDPCDADAWRAAIRPETRLLFGESIGNPGLDVLDIPTVAQIAHDRRLPLLIDATLVTPCLQQPLTLGADLVLHSATKFLGGHGVAVGGLLVDGGRFDWEASGLFPTLTEPYEGFHGMDFAEESPIAAFSLRARREGLRDFGAGLSPFNAFQILQGMETLPLRMRAHVANAQPPRPRAGRKIAAGWCRLGAVLRTQRRSCRRTRLHRCATRVLASGQRRRRQIAGDPPRQHHPLAYVGRGSGERRHHRRHDTALGRTGERQRPDRRPQSRAVCGRQDRQHCQRLSTMHTT